VTEYVLERTQVVAVPIEQAFEFFADARNLERITPSWLRFRILETPGELADGVRLRYRLSLFGIPIRWGTEIVAWTPPRGFVDVQRRGPFLLWEHTHRLTPVEGGTEIYDHVRYRLFLGPLGALVRRLLVRRWVEGIFDYRAGEVPRLLMPAPAAQPRRTA
jgi:ligand-binding SRPBCC domain-containing protein